MTNAKPLLLSGSASATCNCLECISIHVAEYGRWHTEAVDCALEAGVQFDWLYKHDMLGEMHYCASVIEPNNFDKVVAFIDAVLRLMPRDAARGTLQMMYATTYTYEVEDYSQPFECNPVLRNGFRLVLPNVHTHGLLVANGHDCKGGAACM